MSQKLSVNDFKYVEGISECNECNEDFTKSYNDESDIGYFLGIDLILDLHKIHNNLPFQLERMKIEKS